MKTRFLFLLLFAFAFQLFSQTDNQKREFRAVWIATVSNIDWPTNKNLTPQQQRNEYINILNQHYSTNINAIIQQIRPSCDAFYPSALEPWSEWLNGTQSAAPNPYYDPLQFMINEVHKRGMEFHAWFNPYRAVLNKNSSSVSASHVSIVHPDWVVTFGNYKWLDPGLPQVRDYVTAVIMDVVRRYDIDGVHFDDYFYPYPQTGVEFGDSATFATYPRGFTNKDDWRRDNVDLLIQMLQDSINSIKPYVKYGMSPFGIWKNNTSDPLGSATAGFESYYGIYADSRKWLEEGWIDYIAPQVYWSFDFTVADYSVLVPWWAQNSFGKHVYIGQGAYKIGTSTQHPGWMDPAEMPKQIRLNRTIPEVNGSIFFSSKSVRANPLHFQDSLKMTLYKYQALPPVMEWKDSIPPLPPVNLQVEMNQYRFSLTWEKPLAAVDGDTAVKFVIYRFEHPDTVNLNDGRFVRFITPKDTNRYFDAMPIDTNKLSVTFAVTSVDRMNNESEPALYTVVLTGVKDEISVVNDFQLFQNYPNPFNPRTKIRFSIPAVESNSGASPQNVLLKVHDVLGREVATLVNEQKAPGSYEVEFDANSIRGGLTSGVYFYKLSAGGRIKIIKMILQK